MMNNHGISLKEMLLLLCILLFCLLLACFYGESLKSNSLSTGSDNVSKVESSNNSEEKQPLENKVEKRDLSNYINYEKKMIEAAQKYIDFYNYESFSDDLILTLNNLIHLGFIEKLYDNGEVCSGYVLVKENNGNFVMDEYLECPNYVTIR